MGPAYSSMGVLCPWRGPWEPLCFSFSSFAFLLPGEPWSQHHFQLRLSPPWGVSDSLKAALPGAVITRPHPCTGEEQLGGTASPPPSSQALGGTQWVALRLAAGPGAALASGGPPPVMTHAVTAEPQRLQGMQRGA